MSNFTDSFLSANTANFPSEQLPSLRERLAQLDDSQANQVIAAADVKKPYNSFDPFYLLRWIWS